MCLIDTSTPKVKATPPPPPPPLQAPEAIEIGEVSRDVKTIQRRRRGTRGLRVGLGIPGADSSGSGLSIPSNA